MLHLLFGKRYEEVGSGVTATFRRTFELLGMSIVGDFLPWLRWLDIGGLYWHAAGTDDTTSTMLTWGLSLILNNDNVLEKIQGELDNIVRRERHVNESDLGNLTYFQAVIKETSFRLYPPGPLLIPHEAMEDCKINGYHVFKGTRVMINVSKIQRDPNFWVDPDAFKPERFLMEHKDIDLRGNHFDLIPFGIGRRICPGMSLALQSMQLGLAAVIHSFDIKRCSDEPIDMTDQRLMAWRLAKQLHSKFSFPHAYLLISTFDFFTCTWMQFQGVYFINSNYVISYKSI
ncbi:xanthotoxin 5-hydroxylase CYP82C4-like [Ipomoea triloba]|uniref:xanthotoxin 5-hydroxylase CYP82C4-like n=1 Tax=Ipomoea triloba TaxID=35885 RepID=UPI00125D608D|nr:xanthotoxin 5-hydroxylase CYP82C4-like [Ipomoea triloba]